jgi:hypothetical protein
MQKFQTTTELTSRGTTKPICYGGNGKRAIRELLDKYVEQFTTDEAGDWLFGGFSAAQLEGIAAELNKRNSKAWKRLKKETKRIYSRALNNATESEPQSLGVCSSESPDGDVSDKDVGPSELELGSCISPSCSSSCTDSSSVSGGADCGHA